MENILSYRLNIPPDRALAIAKDRIIDHPGMSIEGDDDRGILKWRGIRVNYTMKPVNGGADLLLEFTRKPPVPWKFIKKVIDNEARKW